jgi:L,D-peptidoglycan transpeptidase YkuD (ErfK/YbiS/YcfS/YnhG family)
MHRRFARSIAVFQRPLERQKALLVCGALSLPVAIGKGGTSTGKREGDGATPLGRFRFLGLWRRPDKKAFGPSALPQRYTRRTDLWCDASGHRLYNRRTRAPCAASHEEMWRQDDVYDVVLEIDWNIKPRIMGRGSAIFMHLARDGYAPTAGCIALSPTDMRKLLPLISPATRLVIRR